MPSVRFRPGLFSDSGYRFRENAFSKDDHWLPGLGMTTIKFYDVTFFSADLIDVGEDYPIIAEMYFRIKSDAISHSRAVFSVMDWLGAVSGIEEFLMDLCIFALGGYV